MLALVLGLATVVLLVLRLIHVQCPTFNSPPFANLSELTPANSVDRYPFPTRSQTSRTSVYLGQPAIPLPIRAAASPIGAHTTLRPYTAARWKTTAGPCIRTVPALPPCLGTSIHGTPPVTSSTVMMNQYAIMSPSDSPTAQHWEGNPVSVKENMAGKSGTSILLYPVSALRPLGWVHASPSQAAAIYKR